MIELNNKTTKYAIKMMNNFKKDYKKIKRQNKDILKLKKVIEILANGEELDEKYKNHKLINDKYYQECYECHISPDWLLIYKYIDNELILLMIATGSHSELFNK